MIAELTRRSVSGNLQHDSALYRIGKNALTALAAMRQTHFDVNAVARRSGQMEFSPRAFHSLFHALQPEVMAVHLPGIETATIVIQIQKQFATLVS